MVKLVLRRLLMSIPLIVFVSMLTFLLEAFAPGDLARTILGQHYTPEGYAQVRQELGLDQPLPVQYWRWLEGVLHGNFGVSPISGLDVGSQLSSRLPVTLSLIVATTLLASVVGIGLGAISAVRGGAWGRVVDVLSLVGFALPSFWFGLILVALFAVKLGFLPATGYVPFTDSPVAWLRSLALPVVTLAVAPVAMIAKQTRDGMLDALNRDFVHTLRANGASEISIIFRHALRNAAIPVVAIIGLIFVGLSSGTVLIESVFALPGLGGLALTSTTQHDLPMIEGVTVTFTVIVVIVNLIVDLGYGWLNPKVRAR